MLDLAAAQAGDGDVDAIAGLLSLRERQPFSIHATAREVTEAGVHDNISIAIRYIESHADEDLSPARIAAAVHRIGKVEAPPTSEPGPGLRGWLRSGLGDPAGVQEDHGPGDTGPHESPEQGHRLGPVVVVEQEPLGAQCDVGALAVLGAGYPEARPSQVLHLHVGGLRRREPKMLRARPGKGQDLSPCRVRGPAHRGARAVGRRVGAAAP